jgi:hypothetical protein
MNVLILTPDAVGSTLLQRVLTIYMQFHNFGRPVINLHELTNGLACYYSPEFNQEIVSKHALKEWGYYQTLEEVVGMLNRVDHYKTSRLAHYHLVRRGDSIEQQIPFYRYLNENFYIIACRRENVFEHALSMTLNTVTKKLNVYDVYEKMETFFDIYKSGVALDVTVFEYQLDAYKNYLVWSQQYFDIGSYFRYEQDIPRLEEYVLNLPIFSNQTKLQTWKGKFGLNFNEWNQMHYVRSDFNALLAINDKLTEKLMSLIPNMVEDYQQHAPDPSPPVFSASDISALPKEAIAPWAQGFVRREGLIAFMDAKQRHSLDSYKEGYSRAQTTIDQMVKLGIIPSGPPIKKQTLGEKNQIITNFDNLVEVYNRWVSANPGIGNPIDNTVIQHQISVESNFWWSIINANEATLALPPNLP